MLTWMVCYFSFFLMILLYFSFFFVWFCGCFCFIKQWKKQYLETWIWLIYLHIYVPSPSGKDLRELLFLNSERLAKKQFIFTLFLSACGDRTFYFIGLLYKSSKIINVEHFADISVLHYINGI